MSAESTGATASATATATIIKDVRHSPKNIYLEGYKDSFQEVVLPAGTILFKALKRDASGFFMLEDLIGKYIEGRGFCLTPIQQIFTFPFPSIGFGLYDWVTESPAWNRFDTILIYVLNRSARFLSMICPSQAVRGTVLSLGDTVLPKTQARPIVRCNKFPEFLADCIRPPTTLAKLMEMAHYDNCINPYTGTPYLGHISIGNSDSLDSSHRDPRTKRKIVLKAPETPMGRYLLSIGTDPEFQLGTIAQLYTDKAGSRGFPEIVVRSRPDISATIMRPAATFAEGLAILQKDLTDGVVPLVPYGVITEHGFLDSGRMFEMGAGTVTGTGVAVPAPERKTRIERICKQFLANPDIAFDRRTGFFVIASAWKEGEWYYDYLMPLGRSNNTARLKDYIVSHREPRVPGGDFIFCRPDFDRTLADLGLAVGRRPREGGRRQHRLGLTRRSIKRGQLSASTRKEKHERVRKTKGL